MTDDTASLYPTTCFLYLPYSEARSSPQTASFKELTSSGLFWLEAQFGFLQYFLMLPTSVCTPTSNAGVEPESMGGGGEGAAESQLAHLVPSRMEPSPKTIKDTQGLSISRRPQRSYTNSESWKHKPQVKKVAPTHSLENVQYLQGSGFSPKTQDKVCGRIRYSGPGLSSLHLRS